MNGVEKLINTIKWESCPSEYDLKDVNYENFNCCKFSELNSTNLEICEECWRLSLEQTYEE